MCSYRVAGDAGAGGSDVRLGALVAGAVAARVGVFIVYDHGGHLLPVPILLPLGPHIHGVERWLGGRGLHCGGGGGGAAHRVAVVGVVAATAGDKTQIHIQNKDIYKIKTLLAYCYSQPPGTMGLSNIGLSLYLDGQNTIPHSETRTFSRSLVTS